MTDGPARHRRAFGALLLAGLLTHAPGLTYPREVVFDEATFGKYVAAYCCTGERIFDVHPPHGKLLIAAAAKLGGFDGQFSFERIGLPYGDTPVWALRLVPALAGALIPALFLWLLLECGASFPAALLGGILLAADNAILLETKIIVWDGVLVASTLAAIAAFLAALKRTPDVNWRFVLAGALAGLAVGCKLTGLAAPGLMAICLAFGIGGASGRLSVRVKQAAVLIAAGAVIYLGGWWIHWTVLSQPGPADGFYTTTGSFLKDMVTFHEAMVRENVRLAATHPDSSAPWTWPLMRVAPYFWQGDGASIYLVGNPLVWWGSSAALVIIGLASVLQGLGWSAPTSGNDTATPWLAIAGYAIAFAPLLPVGRVLFLYHYLTPLTFAVGFTVLWLDRHGWIRAGGVRAQRISYFVVIGLAILCFLAVSPLTYGFNAGGYDEWLAAVVRSWR